MLKKLKNQREDRQKYLHTKKTSVKASGWDFDRILCLNPTEMGTEYLTLLKYTSLIFKR